MYGEATTGKKPNNLKFSDCSKDSMSGVISSLVESEKFCFKGL